MVRDQYKKKKTQKVNFGIPLKKTNKKTKNA